MTAYLKISTDVGSFSTRRAIGPVARPDFILLPKTGHDIEVDSVLPSLRPIQEFSLASFTHTRWTGLGQQEGKLEIQSSKFKGNSNIKAQNRVIERFAS